MSDERKPSEDLKEGLGLIFRAARSAAKQVDVSKIDKGLDKAISQATRVATHVGRAVADEINRMSSSTTPPWQSDSDKAAGVQDPPPADEGEGHVWASQAQQSEPTPNDKDAADKSDEGEPPKVRVETETDKT
jgi:hypothetical protein